MHGFRLGRLLGIPIELRYSFVFLLALAYCAGVAEGIGLWPLLLLVGAFASVLIHELAHALVARWLGVPTIGIDLTLLGGSARMAVSPRRPRDEALIALAGPAASLLLAGLGLALDRATGIAAFGYLGDINGLIAGFNLLPLFPLDGGRVLRAVLSARVGHEQATLVVMQVTRLAAVVGSVAGVLLGKFFVPIFGALLWVMASSELRRARRMAIREEQPGWEHYRVEILDENGHPAGCRPATLGATYVIEEHTRADQRKRWCVRGPDGAVVLITETPLRNPSAVIDNPLVDLGAGTPLRACI